MGDNNILTPTHMCARSWSDCEREREILKERKAKNGEEEKLSNNIRLIDLMIIITTIKNNENKKKKLTKRLGKEKSR